MTGNTKKPIVFEANGFTGECVQIDMFAPEIDLENDNIFTPGFLHTGGTFNMEILPDPNVELRDMINEEDGTISIHFPGITTEEWGSLGFRRTTKFKRKKLIRSVIKYPNYTKRGYKKLKPNEPYYVWHPPAVWDFEGEATIEEDGTLTVKVK